MCGQGNVCAVKDKAPAVANYLLEQIAAVSGAAAVP